MKKINKAGIASIVLAGATIAGAMPYNVFLADSNVSESGQPGTSESSVLYEKEASYQVLIPKEIRLDTDTKSAEYSITVKGEGIPAGSKVSVAPQDKNDEEEGINFNMTQISNARSGMNVTATVTQDETEWSPEEVIPDGTAKKGVITAPDLTFGNWKGSLQFNIDLIDETSHTHNYVDGVCSICGKNEPGSGEHTHNYTEDITKQPSCTEDGEKTLTCECGDSKTETIPATGHDYADGVCSSCGGLDPEYMPVVSGIENGGVYNIGQSLTLRDGEMMSVNGSPVVLDNNSYVFNDAGTYEIVITAPNGNSITITITIGHTHNFQDGFCTECGAPDSAVYSDAGLYSATGKKLATWNELTEDYGVDITSGTSVSSILQGASANPNNSNYVVVLPDGTESIGNKAFMGCNKMKAIIIPDSVSSIGSQAFANCSILNNVVLPEGITTLNTGLFSGCTSLTNVEIPESVETIGGAFSGCTSLKDVKLPSRTKSLYFTFQGCTSLEDIVIPDSVTNISGYAFDGCSKLKTVTLGSNVTTISDCAFQNCTALESIELPNSVKTIGSHAFNGCSSLSEVLIPESVQSIERAAFFGTAISDIEIPNATIKAQIFDGDTLKTIRLGTGVKIDDVYTKEYFSSSNLVSIDVAEDNEDYCSVDGVMFSKDMSKIIRYPSMHEGTTYEFPEAVTSIGKFAFFKCNNLTEIDMPTSITVIEENAFKQCDNLTKVSASGKIGTTAFANCPILSDFQMKNTVTEIGQEAFYRCTSLKKIYIPSSVSYIRSNAGHSPFNSCSPDLVINCADSSAGSYWETDWNVYKWEANNQGVVTKRYPLSVVYSVSAMQYLYGFTGEETTVEIPEGLTVIPDGAFQNFSNLESVVIPEGIEEIGEKAFYNCEKLTNVTLPSSLKKIGNYAFKCTSIPSISIPDSVTEIGRGAFSDSKLTSIKLPNGLTTISQDMFYWCTELISCEIPDSVTTIGYQAFYYNKLLKEITIPDTVESINPQAFRSCTDLVIHYNGPATGYPWGATVPE